METPEKEFDKLVEAAIEKIEGKITEVKEASKADFDKIQTEYQKTVKEIKELNIESLSDKSDAAQAKIDELHQKHGDLVENIAKLNTAISGLKEAPVPKEVLTKFKALSWKEQFAVLLKSACEHSEFKDFESKGYNGISKRLTMKDVYKAPTGVAGEHTGDMFIDGLVDYVKDEKRSQIHMRDLISVEQTSYETLTWGTITFVDSQSMGVQLDENEEIVDLNFETGEDSSKVKRVGVSLPISQRYLRGDMRTFYNHVQRVIPTMFAFQQDTQILFGDGEGKNVDGIKNNARTLDIGGNTYAAGAIASVATYKGGAETLVTFAAKHKIGNGDTVTFLNATESTYNATHKSVIVLNEKQIVIRVAYVAEADTSAWTGTSTNRWYQRVTAPTMFDVANCAASRLRTTLYKADAILLNPDDYYFTLSEKNDDKDYLNKRFEELGLTVVIHERIPAGMFLIGSFDDLSISIVEYTPMRLQFLQDISTARTNSILLLMDSEYHLRKMNKDYYIYDEFDRVKTLLQTPSS